MPDRIVDFRNPPLYEVVFGVRFEPFKNWKSPHAGLFWKEVFEDFSNCQHAHPLFPLPQDEAGLVYPRIWLINNNDDRLVQLQPDRFLYNWRRRDEVGDYPHFEELWIEFMKYFEQYKIFCENQKFDNLNIIEFELTYVNHIYGQDIWTFPASTKEVIRPLVWHEKMDSVLASPKQVNWQAIFSLPENCGELHAHLSSAISQNLLVLQLSARGQPREAPLDNMAEWFAMAHKWVVHGFLDITTEEAQSTSWGQL